MQALRPDEPSRRIKSGMPFILGIFQRSYYKLCITGTTGCHATDRGWGKHREGNLRFSGKGELAFTGLEAALILIAFVVVAAVFSYTILNTGFMVTQQSRNTIFTAVEQTTSTLDMSSDVYGIGEAGTIYGDCIRSISPAG